MLQSKEVVWHAKLKNWMQHQKPEQCKHKVLSSSNLPCAQKRKEARKDLLKIQVVNILLHQEVFDRILSDSNNIQKRRYVWEHHKFEVISMSRTRYMKTTVPNKTFSTKNPPKSTCCTGKFIYWISVTRNFFQRKSRETQSRRRW